MNNDTLRPVWAAWCGNTRIIVPGRTRKEALWNARERGIEPDVLVRAGGLAAPYAQEDAEKLRREGW